MKRVGVFVCHCGTNISATVDVVQVAKDSLDFPNVVHAEDNKYMCSEPGQDVIRKAIKEHNLDGVVVSACSPRMHETTFRRTLESVGMNAYLLECANIREQCSWVHPDKEKGTIKARSLTRISAAKVVNNYELQKSTMSIEKRALVIGGGIAGIQAALDIAENGFKVDLVEREPSIGGKMAQIDKTFPTLDCSACILTPKMVDAAAHENIELITYSEINKVEGYVGNFDVTIRKKARSVDMVKCTGCGICWEKCPKKIPSEFELGLGNRKAIYTPFPQAIPNKPVIDREVCRFFTSGKCKVCQKVCPTGAVDFDLQDEFETRKYGAIVVATGFELFDHSVYGEYGYGKYPDVITGLHFERLVNASGPTAGKIKRPSDGEIPKNIVFIKCVGSRDEAKGKPYCSKTCCMYTAKHATLVSEKIPDSKAYVFYMDVRTPGKDYDEFYTRTHNKYGADYIRGRVAKIYQQGKKLIVIGEDTLLGKQVEIEADLVVLATAMVANDDAAEFARKVGFSFDSHKFYTEAHPKLRPVETHTAGVFLAGACQGPKDIPESVAQASAAAVKATGLLSKEQMATDPMVAFVNNQVCFGCGACVPMCPYKALELVELEERIHGKTKTRKVSSVNMGLCQGCGACTVACRPGAINLRGFTNEQILAEVDTICL